MSAALKIITDASLLFILDIYNPCRTISIVRDSTHLSHCLLCLLPSGRRSQSLHACSSRLRKSFLHQAFRMLNNLFPFSPPPPKSLDYNLRLPKFSISSAILFCTVDPYYKYTLMHILHILHTYTHIIYM